MGIEDSGAEIERESEDKAEPEGRRESGKGVRSKRRGSKRRRIN